MEWRGQAAGAPVVVAPLPGRGWPGSRAIAPPGVGKDAPPHPPVRPSVRGASRAVGFP
ncbi:MAG: hypothetical protein AVDCRST_MAG70-280 [uncultured Thermomicrobiales bacterium]|uniref:Uncharacterized protein n=1 Tax=uncultured Thermomicrobiales bacterium TaxID=1645740 RepID=A0A6J4U976_9BACT|nr:MAG: hypothetical protein AVDCRST_MAG70-280 [uncultured Thermomicrobiales bacterium]